MARFLIRRLSSENPHANVFFSRHRYTSTRTCRFKASPYISSEASNLARSGVISELVYTAAQKAHATPPIAGVDGPIQPDRRLPSTKPCPPRALRF